MGKLCGAQGRSFHPLAGDPFQGAIFGVRGGDELCGAQGQRKNSYFNKLFFL